MLRGYKHFFQYEAHEQLNLPLMSDCTVRVDEGGTASTARRMISTIPMQINSESQNSPAETNFVVPYVKSGLKRVPAGFYLLQSTKK